MESAGRYVETYSVSSWAEHLRQHERLTKADRETEERVLRYVISEPKVRHLISAEAALPLEGECQPDLVSKQLRQFCFRLHYSFKGFSELISKTTSRVGTDNGLVHWDIGMPSRHRPPN